MKKLFITYEQAVALKKLGFDEPCLATFQIAQDGRIGGLSDLYMVESNNSNNKSHTAISAPLYQQAFAWFRETFDIHGSVSGRYMFEISGAAENQASFSKEYETYEEAELACLDKLIEIVKEKQK